MPIGPTRHCPAFLPLAIRSASAEDEVVRLFLNALADDQIGSRADCFLGLGGGDLALNSGPATWTCPSS